LGRSSFPNQIDDGGFVPDVIELDHESLDLESVSFLGAVLKRTRSSRLYPKARNYLYSRDDDRPLVFAGDGKEGILARGNLVPLSFTGVEKEIFVEAFAPVRHTSP